MAHREASLFPPTRWTLIERVRSGADNDVRSALEILCTAYWQPLYCVARRRGLPEPDAKDAVQGFFESLLRREAFGSADPERGKLRHYLLGAFDKYCSQQWNRSNCQKRGGGVEHVGLKDALAVEEAEQHFLKSGAFEISVETLYMREWAAAVLQRGLEALRDDYVRRGWQERYNLMVGALLQKDADFSLEQLAATAGLAPGTLRVMLHRMRGHYRSQIERELCRTLDTDQPELIRQEMADLFKAFA